MRLIFLLFVVSVACDRFLIERANSEEPENAPELVKILREKYSIKSMLNNDGQIYFVGMDDASDINLAVDRAIKIPSIEVVSFHWEIERKHVNRETLKKLSRLPRLSLLDANYCRIQDEDAASLAELKQLQELRLNGNPITDRALAYLEPLRKLELLYLFETKITGTGFKHLQTLPRLRNLYLRGSPVTNESLAELSKVASLKVLDLTNTPLNDEGLMHLTGLYRLVHLSVGDTKVSQEGREAFLREHGLHRAQAQKKGLISKDYPPLHGFAQ